LFAIVSREIPENPRLSSTLPPTLERSNSALRLITVNNDFDLIHPASPMLRAAR